MFEIYKLRIKKAILDKIGIIGHLHKKSIKAAVDEIKSQYIFDRNIKPKDLNKIAHYFKENWKELKDLSQDIRRNQGLTGFISYNII